MTILKIKKQKAQKSVSKNYKNCLKATQRENEINHLGKKKIDTDNVKENHKEFIKNSILKIQ